MPDCFRSNKGMIQTKYLTVGNAVRLLLSKSSNLKLKYCVTVGWLGEADHRYGCYPPQ